MPQQPPQEEPPESIVFGQFDGLKNTVSPERLGPGDLERALNIDLDDAKQPRRRRGYVRKITGSFHSVHDIAGKVYGVKDGVLGIVRPDYSFLSLAVSIGTAPVCYTDVNEEVYFSSENAAGIIAQDETVGEWGHTDGQGTWLSPVLTPTTTLGEVSGRLLGDPPRATSIAAYKGRIYLARGKTLWATELYMYHYVDRTRGFMQFEHEITLLMAMEDGLFVGTTGGLYFIQGVFGSFKITQVTDAAVLPGSGVWVPAELVHPQAVNGPVGTGMAAMMMTNGGVVAGFDGGSCFNLTSGRVVFPEGVSAAGLFRQDQGANSYVAVVDSAGAPAANARIGDYVDAEIRRFGG